MKLKVLITVIMLLSCFSLHAQNPEELLQKYVTNISLPDKNIRSFVTDLSIINESSVYLVQLRYEGEKVHFSFFDQDKTPFVVMKNTDVLFNDVLNSRIDLFRNNILTAKAIFENGNQLNATFNFHEPNKEENQNTVKIDFLTFAQQGSNNMRVDKENGLTIIEGETQSNSTVTTILDTNDAFPLRKLTITGEGFSIIFDNIRFNTEIDQKIYDMPTETLRKTGLSIVDLTTDNFLEGIQLVQTIMTSGMIRAALNDPEMQKEITEKMNIQLDWASLKAADRLMSAKLRSFFKPL